MNEVIRQLAPGVGKGTKRQHVLDKWIATSKETWHSIENTGKNCNKHPDNENPLAKESVIRIPAKITNENAINKDLHMSTPVAPPDQSQ